MSHGSRLTAIPSDLRFSDDDAHSQRDQLVVAAVLVAFGVCSVVGLQCFTPRSELPSRNSDRIAITFWVGCRHSAKEL